MPQPDANNAVLTKVQANRQEVGVEVEVEVECRRGCEEVTKQSILRSACKILRIVK